MKSVLVESIYLYCIKHGFSPHIVCVNCPPYLSNFADNGTITLNLSDNALAYVNFSDDVVKIGVAFNRKHYDLEFNINEDIVAIYAKENPNIGFKFKQNIAIEQQKTKQPHLRLVK